MCSCAVLLAIQELEEVRCCGADSRAAGLASLVLQLPWKDLVHEE